MGRRSRKSKRRMNSLFMTLLLTALMLIMSTYAWFSANRQVEINGITAKVRAAEGLQISLDGVSWDTAVTVNKAALVALTSTVNKVAWADKLEPVSCDGTYNTTSGELNFYYGEVSPDGSILKNVGQTASALTTSVEEGETGNTGPTNKYIAFDIYLKNSSSRQNDNMNLANGSSVAINATEGQDNTGLEYSVRTAIEFYSNAAGFTDSQSVINAKTFGTPQIAIWEPNYDQHIAEIQQNDPRITAVQQAWNTLAMNSTAVGNNIQGINVGESAIGSALAVTLDANGNVLDTPAGVAGTYMTIPSTIQTSGNLQADTPLYNVNGTGTGYQITIPGNAITKARVYIWIEGQDPDCQDTASTGKAFDLKINLSKDPVT